MRATATTLPMAIPAIAPVDSFVDEEDEFNELAGASSVLLDLVAVVVTVPEDIKLVYWL
jgi:hypothetical protein